ncbi:MAG: M23 family peptidase, partial [Alteromonadales bacterium]|nr:M23 family peptidase [Alteromonadales bacterium]
MVSTLSKNLVKSLISVAVVTSISLSSLTFAASPQKTVTAGSIVLSGEVKQGGLMVGKTSAQNTVTLNGKAIAVSAGGDYAFGFSRDDKQSYELVITSVNGDRVTKTLSPKKRDYKLQRIEGIKKSIMQPNPKAVARSQKDSKQIKAAR